MPGRRVLLRGELLSALSAVLLLIAMSALEWYGVDRTPSLVSTENAWQGLSVISWVMLVTCATAIASVPLHLRRPSGRAWTSTALAVTALGALTAVLVAYRVLIDLPNANAVVDQKLGAFVGLLCAIGIPLGGFDSLRAQRALVLEQRSRSRAEALEGGPTSR
jgi:hypothetical protein